MFCFMPFIIFLLVGTFAVKINADETSLVGADETSLVDHVSQVQLQMHLHENSHKSLQAAAAAPAADSDVMAASALPEGGSQLAEQPQVESSLLATEDSSILQDTQIKSAAVLAEYIAMTLFVVIGCGSAMGIAKEPGSAWIFQVSLTFGFAITVLAYAIGHYSGGQINCAVTFGLVLIGQCTIAQGLMNLLAQLLGSVTGSLILLLIYPREKDLTGGLASNAVSEGWGVLNALVGEFMMTFLLVFVVLETAINPASSANSAQAPIAIGFAVFLAHSVLIPIDGCSINPTRSFGPALVGLFTKTSSQKPLTDMWIFWVGPLLGAAAAADLFWLMQKCD